MRNRLVLGFLIIPLLFVPSLLAQTAPSNQDARLAKLEATAADAKSSADNAWMLTSSALVLMMTGPCPLLRGPGAQEERPRHHGPELFHDGRHHYLVGARQLQPCLRRRQQLHRWTAPRLSAWCGRAARR